MLTLPRRIWWPIFGLSARGPEDRAFVAERPFRVGGERDLDSRIERREELARPEVDKPAVGEAQPLSDCINGDLQDVIQVAPVGRWEIDVQGNAPIPPTGS